MARTRLINPNAPKDEAVASCSLAARYTWAYLPCYADREGRLPDKPFTLRLDIFPTEPVDMDRVLGELAAVNLIRRYQVGGQKCIEIRNFARYQKPHKHEAASALPPPPTDVGESPDITRAAATSTSAPVDAGSRRSGSLDPGPVADPGREISGVRARDPVAVSLALPADPSITLTPGHGGIAAIHSPNTGFSLTTSTGVGVVTASPAGVVVGARPARPPWRSAYEWCQAFGRLWAERYDTLTYGDPGDGKAQAKLQDLLDAMPDDELVALWEAREAFFRRYLASEDQTLVRVRKSFAFFVGRWNDFRPDLDAGGGARRRPGTIRICDWHMDLDNTGQVAPRPDPACAECQKVGQPSRAPPKPAAAPTPIRDAVGR